MQQTQWPQVATMNSPWLPVLCICLGLMSITIWFAVITAFNHNNNKHIN